MSVRGHRHVSRAQSNHYHGARRRDRLLHRAVSVDIRSQGPAIALRIGCRSPALMERDAQSGTCSKIFTIRVPVDTLNSCFRSAANLVTAVCLASDRPGPAGNMENEHGERLMRALRVPLISIVLAVLVVVLMPGAGAAERPDV